LIVAHPGHELRVHGWLVQARPTSFVLTQGDGPTRVSRLQSTTDVLTGAGASIGGLYGALRDREIYAALLERRHDLFIDILEALANALIDSSIGYVVSDAEERYNPSHDVCRYLASAAAAIASRTSGRNIRGYDFPLIGRPDVCPPELCARAIWVQLDDEALERKLSAAAGYPELAYEIDAALTAVGTEAFRTECLRPWTSPTPEDGSIPFYERYGERQVAAGVYSDVIRLQHLLSLRNVLWRHAGVDF
jgi:AcrR family transcriptional regulator